MNFFVFFFSHNPRLKNFSLARLHMTTHDTFIYYCHGVFISLSFIFQSSLTSLKSKTKKKKKIEFDKKNENKIVEVYYVKRNKTYQQRGIQMSS